MVTNKMLVILFSYIVISLLYNGTTSFDPRASDNSSASSQVVKFDHFAVSLRTASATFASNSPQRYTTRCLSFPCIVKTKPEPSHDSSDCYYSPFPLLPYHAPASLSILFPISCISLMIAPISVGVTMNGFFGKCLMLPVTR